MTMPIKAHTRTPPLVQRTVDRRHKAHARTPIGVLGGSSARRASGRAGLAGLPLLRPWVDAISAPWFYGSFSVHLLALLEGFGFCAEGESGAFVQDGRIEIGGELPCNTSGGMLSESYMQSWNHQPELVRQLRGGLGPRQVQGAEIAQYIHDVAGKCKSLIYTKGA
jgi:acetyl-CoA acetyltransferase